MRHRFGYRQWFRKRQDFETHMDRKGRAGRYQTLTKQEFENLKVALKDMGRRPKSFEFKEILEGSRSYIEAALAQGWLFEDIQRIFAQHGVSVSVRTLKRYLAASANAAEDDRDEDNDGLAGDSDMPDLGTGSSPA